MQRATRIAALGVITLAASCATTQVVKQDVTSVIKGQPMDNSQLKKAVASDTTDIGKQLAELRQKFAEEVTTLRAKAQKHWGQHAQVADRTVYVKYSQNYTSRVIT